MRKGERKMYRGTHVAPRRRRRNNPVLLVISLVLVLALAVGGTVAWLTSVTDPVTNVFVPGTGGTNIDEDIVNNAKTKIVIENKGNIDAYVRVKLVINCIDENGNVVAGAVPSVSYDGTKWDLINGCYYYKGVVEENGETTNLLADRATIPLTGENGVRYEVNVIAQTIQTVGGAVEDAWQMSYTDGSWAVAQAA